MDVGYWSSDNEAWYQKRLDLIRDCGQNGRRLCMTANQWRNALKYFKEMSQIDRFSLGPIGDSKRGIMVLEGAGILARGTGFCT